MKQALAALAELKAEGIAWLLHTGQQQTISRGTVLICQGQPVDQLYVVLEGTLTVSISQTREGLDGPSANPLISREVAQLLRGEVVGEVSFVDSRPPTATVTALEESKVLAIPWQTLADKLKADDAFAANFYHILAVRLSERLRRTTTQLSPAQMASRVDQPLRKVLFVFGELSGLDIDWLAATGHRETLPLGTCLIQQGQPVDALYILLEGALTVSILLPAETGDLPQEQEITRLSPGEIVGEMSFIDTQPPSATVRTAQESLVLVMPRSQLLEKLQADGGLAVRFYRAISILLADRLRSIVLRLSAGHRVYNWDQTLEQDIEYGDELNPDVLDRVALAGTRFDWMLRRLRGG